MASHAHLLAAGLQLLERFTGLLVRLGDLILSRRRRSRGQVSHRRHGGMMMMMRGTGRGVLDDDLLFVVCMRGRRRARRADAGRGAARGTGRDAGGARAEGGEGLSARETGHVAHGGRRDGAVGAVVGTGLAC